MKNLLLPILIPVLLMMNVSGTIAQEINLDANFSQDTVIHPFEGVNVLYSLSLTGDIVLLSDSSLVRVVLLDNNNNEYLLYESYPMISLNSNVYITGGCDETCFLEGIKPLSLRVDIVNASITIQTLQYGTEGFSNLPELQAQGKWEHDSVKIATMNARIQEENMYWHAGRTLMTGLKFAEKEHQYGSKLNIDGFDYYDGGIFEFLHRRVPVHPVLATNVVDEFDWRTRHDASTPLSHYFNTGGNGWITYPQNQGSCNSCYVFSASHTFADFLNIHCNSLLNRNMSEEELLICTYDTSLNANCGNCNTGGDQACILTRIRDYGVHKENSCTGYFTFPHACSGICNNDTVFSHTGFLPNGAVEDSLKVTLIRYGPLTSGLNNTIFPPFGHAMELVGYKKIKVGDTLYVVNHTFKIVLPSDTAIIGKLSWIFKNSDNVNQYLQYAGLVTTLIPGSRISGVAHKRIGTTTTTIIPKCKDEDGDGYYWWGTNSLPADCGCPSGVTTADEDCNDNDSSLGPYELNVNNPDSLPLYSCTPNNCTKWSTPIEIHSNTTWSGIRHMNRDVIIYPGATLTVDGQVFFSPGTQIKVQKQAQLVLSSSDTINPPRLTSGCGNFWGGIEVWGDPRDPQSLQYQGKVTILNGVIENAACGIKTLNSNYYPDNSDTSVIMGLPTGGIIDAQKAIFRNNVIGVELFPYRNGNHANQSRFTACRFETSARFPDGRTPAYGIKLMGVNNVNISGCTYINSRPDSVHYTYRGSGLYAYNAVFTVNDTNISGRMYDTKFEKLNYGVYSLYSPLGFSSISLKNASFNSNRGGIYLSGFQEVSPVNLKGNKFSMLYNLDTDNQYGIYLENSSGFKVTQDTITGNSFAGGNQFGIIVNNSGPENNYIYHNVFQNLKVGIQGLNINRNSDALIDGGVPVYIPTGLNFICNKFVSVGCTNDFLINEELTEPDYLPGIAYNQRNASNITNPTQEPAGNTFTQDHGNFNDAIYDINISPTVSSILYSHHTSSYPPGLRVKPDDVSNQDKVSYVARPDVGNYKEDESCPDNYYPEDDRAEIQWSINEAKQKMDSLSLLIRLLVDKGSTDTLKTKIETSSSNQTYYLYQELMSASPYLSDTALAYSIEKEDVIPNVMIRDIMVANPQSAKSEPLLATLDKRVNPMPDSMWVEILQGKDIVGALESLVGDLSGWLQRHDLYFNTLADQFINDSTNESVSDSLVSLYQSDNRLSTSYLLAQYYLDHLNFSQAVNILQNIPSQFELNERQTEIYETSLALVILLPKMFIDTLGYLVPDGVQTAALEQLVGNGVYFSNAWSRNILIACGLLNYDEPIVFTNQVKSSRRDQYHWLSSESNTLKFRVYPNPVKEFFIVEYRKNDPMDKAKIEIFDINGKDIRSVPLLKNDNLQVISALGLSSGTYLIQLNVNGKVKESRKIFVVR